jgi:hypothetical protein
LISGETIQDSSTAFVARAMIDQIETLKNTKITDATLREITTYIRVLVNLCNSKLLSDFPIEVVETPIDNIEFETSSSYFPDLKFSKMKNFVIRALGEAEKMFDDGLCIDAIRVLIFYCNIVVFSRFDHSLIIKEKKLDELQSSKSVEKSSHLVNGDDFYG